MTLRRRLMVVFFGLALAPIVVVATAAAVGAVRLGERNARQELGRCLDTLSDLIDGEIEAEKIYLRSLAAELDNPYASIPRAELTGWLLRNARLASRLNNRPAVTSHFLLADPVADTLFGIEGHLTSSRVSLQESWLPPGSIDHEEARRLLHPALRSGDMLPTTTWLRSTGPVLVLAVPLPRAEEGGPPPVLIEELNTVVLLEHVLGQPTFQVLESSFVAARARDRGSWTFLYHSDPSWIALPMESDFSAASLGTQRHKWIFSRSGGKLSVRGLHPSTGWLLGASMSLAPTLAPLRDALRASLALVALMAVLVVVGILLVTRGIGEAVEQIGSDVAAIAGGDLRRTIRLRRSDEFGAIAQHINQMARELVITAESRSIARLSSRLVHDLKGLASQMNLLLYNLGTNYDDPEFRAEFVNLMQQLVGQVESLALRLKRGGEEPQFLWEEVDLDTLVASLLQRRVRTLLPEICLQVELQAGPPVFANEELLTEVLENIVMNAVESMEGKGRLTVRTGRLEGPGQPRAQSATHFIEVEDVGPGMTQVFIDSELFAPFATTKPKGIGLGMYQVRQALNRLGGTIEVTSRIGHGTQVRVQVGRNKP